MKRRDGNSKWFDNCSLCGIKKQLTTMQLTGKGIYSLWLRRMCEDCRNKTLFYFYYGLGFKDTAEIFKSKKRERGLSSAPSTRTASSG